MYTVDQIFWKCVQFIEYFGYVTGLGYELSNILLFIVIQPLLTMTFLFLWVREKKKNKKLSYSNQNVPKSKFINFFWRLSRLLSLLVLGIEILLIYSIFYDIFIFPVQSLIESDVLQYIMIIIPICVLLTYNFLIFGKVSVWLKKP
tara:strand:- start:1550 stop:1987 length:438 start_codon:yes stop_codon:yes gene_type:complete